MIEQPAVDRFGGGRMSRASRIRGGQRIAARVVVREEDCGAAVDGDVGDDLAQWEIDRPGVARAVRKMDAAAFIVEMCDPQDFQRVVMLRETAGKEIARRIEAIDREPDSDTLVPHPAVVARSAPAKTATASVLASTQSQIGQKRASLRSAIGLGQ